ncbi:MAG TPA: hypothetical protein VNV37_09370, partial [Solirubrobacteraceae bacterium]|nr:hypothetical protein [Solirubrobacteraceae bacterium]
ILHGKIDILRAELVNRLQRMHDNGEQLITGEDVEQLSEILAGRASIGRLGDTPADDTGADA